MPDNPTVAQIEVEVTKGDFSPNGLKFDLQVNSFPVVRVDYPHATDDPVVSPTAEGALDVIRELQDSRLEGREEPDSGVIAKDGIGGEVEFEGFVSAPVLETTKVSTSENFSAVGVDARLDALDLSIYTAGFNESRRELGSTTGEKLKAADAAKKGDLIGTLKTVTEELVGNYENSILRVPYRDSRVLIEIQHNINTAGSPSPLDLWYQILENSSVTFDSWATAYADYPYVAHNLTNKIKDMLTSRTSGFWGKMRTLMASFQLYYVPTFGGAGKLIRADEKVSDNFVEVEISGSIVGMADGSPGLLQPGGVVMVAPSASALRRESSRSKDYPPVYAYYPQPLQRGFIQRETPPQWLLQNNGVPMLSSELKPGGKRNLSLEDYIERTKKGEKVRESMDASIGGIMTEMCEVMFKELQLAHSSVALTLPLDFSKNELIGNRTKVTVLSADGPGATFECFVAGLTHFMQLREGKSMSSYTQIRCTHVKF